MTKRISKLRLGKETVRLLDGRARGAAAAFGGNTQDWCESQSYCAACPRPTILCTE
ncbi:MAG TPA: hypothetical protein VFQ76_06060 [Longimicrobiaceae bacterium]|nr:hypothetical protein [Longimicrobiaceae bacterium]